VPAPLVAAIPAIAGVAARAIPTAVGAAGRAASSAASSAGAGPRGAAMAGKAGEYGAMRAGTYGVNKMMEHSQPAESRFGAFIQGAAGPPTGGQYAMY